MFPDRVNAPTQYGLRIKAVVVYLRDYWPLTSTIGIGKGHTKLPEKVLCVGNCTAGFKSNNPFVPGCPFVASEILKKLTGDS